MALFYLKQKGMNTMEYESSDNNSRKESDMFATSASYSNPSSPSNQNMMLGGINLGDIMKQTVMEEMRLIQMENNQNMQRMSGC